MWTCLSIFCASVSPSVLFFLANISECQEKSITRETWSSISPEYLPRHNNLWFVNFPVPDILKWCVCKKSLLDFSATNFSDGFLDPIQPCSTSYANFWCIAFVQNSFPHVLWLGLPFDFVWISAIFRLLLVRLALVLEENINHSL